MNGEKLLNIQQVTAKVNLTQGWIYSMIRAGKFPQGEKIGSARLWKATEVKAWLKEREEKRKAKEEQEILNQAMRKMDIKYLRSE